MHWELELCFEPWRRFLQSRVLANGQVIREIFAVLLHVLCLLSEYICSFFAEKEFSMIGCQSNTFWARLALFGHHAQLHFLNDSRKPRNLLSGEG